MGAYTLIRDSDKNLEHISVIGELGPASAGDFERTLNGLSDATRALVIDMSACKYIDSSIVAVLIRAKRRFGEKFALVVPEKTSLRRLLQILNLEEKLAVEADVWTARERAQHTSGTAKAS